ncbi:MAG: hypothetical protein R3B45_13525 [Bdellovibrionota bacterium]
MYSLRKHFTKLDRDFFEITVQYACGSVKLGVFLFKISVKKILSIVADGCNALFLSMYALIIGPLGILRGPLLLERTFWYLWVLLPLGLMSKFVRGALHWRLGAFDAAINEVEVMVVDLEGQLNSFHNHKAVRRVLEDLYTLLARAYLHLGRIDEAMLVVLRAKKHLSIERLPGLSQLNTKTAHLIRAGLSAGKLLDGGGLATLFVKAPASESSSEASRKKRTPVRKGASAVHKGVDKAADGSERKSGAKIIPFPPPTSTDR